jgi:flagellar protein FlaG
MEIGSVTDIAKSSGYDLQASPPLTLIKLGQHPVAAKDPQASDLAKMDQEQVQRMVEEIQRNLSNLDVSIQFSTYGKDSDQVSVIIAEKESGKVIREIPSKELQSLYTKMQELVGIIFNKKV